MERTKTLLSCLTDKCFPPASSLPPPACFVYNIEVHGEHVYQVSELGLVVHNTCIEKVVDIRFLKPSLARDFADPVKLERMGAFDWSWYKPIELIQEVDGLRVQDGMTRIEAALRAGITKLPAKIFSE
jgi:hypothetical protein